MIDTNVCWKTWSILQMQARITERWTSLLGNRCAHRQGLCPPTHLHLYVCLVYAPIFPSGIHNSSSSWWVKCFKLHSGGGRIREVFLLAITTVVINLRCQTQTVFSYGRGTVLQRDHMTDRKTPSLSVKFLMWRCFIYIFYSTQTQHDRAIWALRESSNIPVILF